MIDQATHLRRLVRRVAEPGRGVPWRPPSPVVERPAGLAQAIAITSGKGGVGKTNLAVNLAVCLARQNRRACLLDCDLGLANADILCNLTPRLTL